MLLFPIILLTPLPECSQESPISAASIKEQCCELDFPGTLLCQSYPVAPCVALPAASQNAALLMSDIL